jgi:hypothetical protein
MEKLPPHPSRPMAFVLMGLGGAIVGYGAALAKPAIAGVGAAIALLGSFQWRMGIAATTANTAAAAINRGDMDRARALVGQARAQHRLTYVHRLLDSHESEIAWREGDLNNARAALDVGRARKDLIPYGAWRRLHLVHLDALYALVLAVNGDDRAETFVNNVRSSENAQPGPLARAELAHAMLLARRGDMNALHRHLIQHHVLFCEGLESRGRALHRVLRRMTATRATSAYRLPVKQATARGSTATWMARVFPAGADLIDVEDGAALATHAPQASKPAPIPVAKSARSGKKVLLLWGLLTVLFLAIYQFASLPGGPGPELNLGLIAGFFLIAIGAILFVSVRQARRGVRVMEEAQRALISGDLDRAQALANTYRTARNQILAAQAATIVAGVLERRGDFAGALVEINRGLGLLAGFMRMSTSDVLYPQMLGTRAYLFGALGHDSESDADLARLAREFPAFPYAAGLVARTLLLRAMRSGDLETAQKIARARSDVSLGAYGEILADLALAIGAEDERERMAAVREDMSALPHFDQWRTAARLAAPRVSEALPTKS